MALHAWEGLGSSESEVGSEIWRRQGVLLLVPLRRRPSRKIRRPDRGVPRPHAGKMGQSPHLLVPVKPRHRHRCPQESRDGMVPGLPWWR